MARKNILIIGGTGIVGIEIVKLALIEDYQVSVISNNSNDILPDEVEHIVANKCDENYLIILQELPNFDVVCDVIEYNIDDAKRLYYAFKNKKTHLIIFSTTLVYDRQIPSVKAICELTPSISIGKYGGYVDCKLAIEKFWLRQNNINITLLRPYHILGRNSLIGVLPLHNRDPWIVDNIVNRKEIKLFNNGKNQFNYIHPRDLASIVCCVAGNGRCYGQAYNALNSKVYTAKQYYLLLAEMLNKPLRVSSITYEEAYGKGWEMTLLPHRYCVDKLQKHTGFTPAISLEVGLADALESYPRKETNTSKIQVHKAMNKGATPSSIAWLGTNDSLKTK